MALTFRILFQHATDACATSLRCRKRFYLRPLQLFEPAPPPQRPPGWQGPEEMGGVLPDYMNVARRDNVSFLKQIGVKTQRFAGQEGAQIAAAAMAAAIKSTPVVMPPTVIMPPLTPSVPAGGGDQEPALAAQLRAAAAAAGIGAGGAVRDINSDELSFETLLMTPPMAIAPPVAVPAAPPVDLAPCEPPTGVAPQANAAVAKAAAKAAAENRQLTLDELMNLSDSMRNRMRLGMTGDSSAGGTAPGAGMGYHGVPAAAKAAQPPSHTNDQMVQ